LQLFRGVDYNSALLLVLFTQRGRQRIEDERIEDSLNPAINPDVIRINQEMSSLLQEAEKAGEAGDIDKVQV
jgi:hypothetical protein